MAVHEQTHVVVDSVGLTGDSGLISEAGQDFMIYATTGLYTEQQEEAEA